VGFEVTKSYFQWVLMGGALALAGCAADSSIPTNGESVGQTKEAVVQWCDIGLAYNGGTWMAKPLTYGCVAGVTTFGFGVPSDIPLTLNRGRPPYVAVTIATYGTTAGDDRVGRFFIDRDGSRSWSAGDTYTRFMPDALTSDQPFIISLATRSLANGSCGPSGSAGAPNGVGQQQSVVGVKRGSTWYIDGNGNGTWDGTAQCDVMADFGAPSDIPTPVGDMIGSSGGTSGSSLVWNFDTDGSWSWSGNPPDLLFWTGFGSSTMRPFSDGSSKRIGTQDGTNVYLDRNGDYTWNGAPIDTDGTGFLPSVDWRFVGSYLDSFG
jgi:hypothetical protein